MNSGNEKPPQGGVTFAAVFVVRLNEIYLYFCLNSDGDIPSCRLKNWPKADWSGKPN